MVSLSLSTLITLSTTSSSTFIHSPSTTISTMDVFIPEDYVTKRRLEKKAKAETTSASEHGKRLNSRSHSLRSTTNVSDPPNPPSISNGFSLVGDNVVFACLSA